MAPRLPHPRAAPRPCRTARPRNRADRETLDAIAAQATAVTAWLRAEGFPELSFELPVQITAPDGSEINGVIDCLASGPAGHLILDHKSSPAPDPATRFEGYRTQLMAYAEALARLWPDRPVVAVAVNWMNEGSASVLELTTAEADLV